MPACVLGCSVARDAELVCRAFPPMWDGYPLGMTSSANEPIQYAASSGAPGSENDDQETVAVEEQAEHADGGYDDRQESLEEADRELFERKDHEDPEARYRPVDHPLVEPRKNDD